MPLITIFSFLFSAGIATTAETHCRHFKNKPMSLNKHSKFIAFKELNLNLICLILNRFYEQNKKLMVKLAAADFFFPESKN